MLQARGGAGEAPAPALCSIVLSVLLSSDITTGMASVFACSHCRLCCVLPQDRARDEWDARLILLAPEERYRLLDKGIAAAKAAGDNLVSSVSSAPLLLTAGFRSVAVCSLGRGREAGVSAGAARGARARRDGTAGGSHPVLPIGVLAWFSAHAVVVVVALSVACVLFIRSVQQRIAAPFRF